MCNNRNTKNGPIRVIAHTGLVCDAFHGNMNHLDNRQDTRSPTSPSKGMDGNVKGTYLPSTNPVP